MRFRKTITIPVEGDGGRSTELAYELPSLRTYFLHRLGGWRMGFGSIDGFLLSSEGSER